VVYKGLLVLMSYNYLLFVNGCYKSLAVFDVGAFFNDFSIFYYYIIVHGILFFVEWRSFLLN
jgi:hypothetical protein